MKTRGRVKRQRPGGFARRQARVRHWEILRDGAPAVVGFLIVAYGAIAVVHLLWPARVGGVLLGVILTVPVWALSLLIVSDPSAASWARGADGEEWTHAALRKAFGTSATIVS